MNITLLLSKYQQTVDESLWLAILVIRTTASSLNQPFLDSIVSSQGPTRQCSRGGGTTSGDYGYMLNHGPGQRSLMSKLIAHEQTILPADISDQRFSHAHTAFTCLSAARPSLWTALLLLAHAASLKGRSDAQSRRCRHVDHRPGRLCHMAPARPTKIHHGK